ncbi:MAG: DegV family protein [Halanaerobiales bacterium]|nr:DegV family protein [Halanaerobiales bacterium]
MEKLKIIVDSACDIPDKFLKENNIELLPFRIIVDQEEYLDGIDIDTEQLFKFLEEKRHITTSQVRATDFENAFIDCAEKGWDCIYLAFSSKMSGAYQTAKLISQNVKEKYPDFNMEVIDTESGSTAIGLLVEKVVQFKNDNLPFEQIVQKTKELSKKVEHIFTLESLERLKTGGRISKTAAMVGEFLNIKPILEVNNGKIELFKKVRGYNKAYKKILKIIEKRNNDLKNKLIGISYSGEKEKAMKLKEMITEHFGTKDFMVNMISNVLTVHLGRSGVGVFFINEK